MADGILDSYHDHRVAFGFEINPSDVARVEPLSNYFPGRLQKNCRSGRTVIGGMFTAVNRDLNTEALRQTLHGSASTGGVNVQHEWTDRTWRPRRFPLRQPHTGESDVLLATQRAPWRYLQRPDQKETRLVDL